METVFNITIKFLQFLCWLLHQGTWGVIPNLVIMLSLFCLVLPSGVPQEDHCGGLKIRFFLFFPGLHFPDFLQLGKFLCPLFVGKFCRIQVEVVFQKGINEPYPIGMNITLRPAYKFFTSTCFTFTSCSTTPAAPNM